MAAAKKAAGYGIIAQLGEHLPYKQRVTGSSPVGPIHISGGVAQLARAHGSYPWCRGFKSPLRYASGDRKSGRLSFIIGTGCLPEGRPG